MASLWKSNFHLVQPNLYISDCAQKMENHFLFVFSCGQFDLSGGTGCQLSKCWSPFPRCWPRRVFLSRFSFQLMPFWEVFVNHRRLLSTISLIMNGEKIYYEDIMKNSHCLLGLVRSYFREKFSCIIVRQLYCLNDILSIIFLDALASLKTMLVIKWFSHSCFQDFKIND